MKTALLLAPLCLLLTSCGSLVSYMFENPNSRATISLQYPGGRNVLSAGEEQRLRREAVMAKRRGDFEICGNLMLNEEGKIDLIFALNESRESHAYLITRNSISRMAKIAELTNRRIIGTFHSHPTTYAIPSEIDVSTARPGSLMLIHSVPTGRTRLWQISDYDGVLAPEELDLDIERMWELAPAERIRHTASRPDSFLPSHVTPAAMPTHSRPEAMPERSRLVPLHDVPRAIPVPVDEQPEAIRAPVPVRPLRVSGASASRQYVIDARWTEPAADGSLE